MGKQVKFMQGNEACVEAAVTAGVRFFAGYPITPSTEIAEGMARKLPQVGGKFIQMEDEIASMAAVIGASLTGLKTMTATSGPGFSLKQENIGYACLCEIPCIIVNIMRGGPSTGLPTMASQGDVMQARWGTHGDHPMIVLVPSSVKDMYDLTIKAVNFSEKYRTPVILLPDEIIAHTREKLEIPDPFELNIVNRKAPDTPPDEYKPYHADPETDIPPMAAFGSGYRFHVTGLIHNEMGYPSTKPLDTDTLIRRIHRKIEKGRDEITMYREYYLDDADIMIFAYGSSARSALRAVRDARSEGIKIGLAHPQTLWPFPDELVQKWADKVSKIIVPEMNLGQIVGEVERAAHGKCEIISVTQITGELFTPGQILNEIRKAA